VIVYGDGEGATAKTPVLNVYGKVNSTQTKADEGTISANGSDRSKPEIYIHDGAEVKSDYGVAVYMPTDGKLEIKNGASITGKTAVYVKSGIITILGGTLKGTGDKAAYSHNGNGASATGDALVVDNCGYPGGAPKVTISGGTFTSANNRGIGSYYGNTATALAHVHASSNTIKIHDSSVDTKWHEIWVTEESGYKLVQGWTVTFKDGEAEPELDRQEIESGKKATAPNPAPTKTGYAFKEWQKGGQTYDFDTSVTADITLTANWTANTYTVAFDKNGGAGAMAAESFTYDAEQKLTANAFTRSGYTFTGWNTKADGSGQAYADQQSVKNLSAEDGATVTLYAQWSKDTAPSMMLAIATASGRTAMRVKWTKVKGADGYDVFMSKCGASEFRRVGSVKASASRVVTVRKLERSTEYKFYVKAWTRKNGKKTYIVTSPTAHALTGGANARYTNPSKVSVKRSSYTLKVGKTATIRATVTGLKKGKEVLNHVGLVRYITSNAKVAKVNSKGKIVAKGKGTCTIYVIATNGVYAKVKVTVK